MILFLGGSGDIGSVAVDVLRQCNHETLAPTSQDFNLTDRQAVKSLYHMLPERYGVIFAAFVDLRRGDTLENYDTNMRIAENVLSEMSPEWMVFMSSIDVYGKIPMLPIRETTSLTSAGWYARAKIDIEDLVTTFSLGRFPSLVMRLPGVFGGRRNRKQAFDQILINGIYSGTISLKSNGLIKRDWTSAWEVAEFLNHFSTNPKAGLVNFVRGDSLTLDEYVAKALEVAPHVRHERLSKTDCHDLPHFVFDPSHFRSSFPDWTFPERQRDIHRLARELVQHHEQSAQP